MEIKKFISNIANFIIERLIELFGFILSLLGILLFAALLTYSPQDPNFVFSNNNEINNILGFKGSVISDFFFTIYWTNFFFSFINNIFYWN